ncbi:hypothetical protein KY289_028147 [Solanum tuberosum]|nr:hypothetical protein KY289_028147 [Solanum tuberosum]
MITLRRLGRNRKLQGLAAAIVKLSDKCEIAKVSVKKGVQNTNSELMAEELKWLTGGTSLSRDREFVVIYQGKDFLPSAVSSAIEERRKQALENNAEAEMLLLELKEDEVPQQSDMDKEGITEEERVMLRKIGLRMKPFLLLGRRGVFDGTEENMDLHWKYRELVKVITGRKNIEEVHHIARMLRGREWGNTSCC